MRAGVRVAYHPQGVRLDGHLLRGGAATRTVDHCTSPPFVPGNRTRCACECKSASGAVARPGRRAQRRPGGRPGRASRAPCRARVDVRRRAGSGSVDGDVRREPDLVDPALVRRQPLAIVSLNAPPSPELDPLLDGALAERLSRRRASPGCGPGARPPRSRWPRRCRRRSRTTTSDRRIGRDAARRARRSRPGRRRRPAPRRARPSR